jgi:farnesyl-diphosphate farnesyltransferase
VLEEYATFHQSHLDRVSRSFAFGIARLDLPLRVSIGLSYLLCRVLDTIEDSHWENPLDQSKSFSQFDSFLMAKPLKADVAAWRALFPKNIPTSEAELLNDAGRLFDELHELSEAEREAVRKPVLSMSAGMKHFTELSSARGEMRIRSLRELNTYCFFVAGIVGELLTGLVRARAADYRLTPNETAKLKIESGCRFGLFLQKINILKDQEGDEKERRYFVHDRSEVLQSLKTDSDHAIDYLLSIPARMASYRRFCAWALFLGLATVPLLKQASLKIARKLPRTDALLLAAKVEMGLGNDEKLRAMYDELSQAAFGDLKAISRTETSYDETDQALRFYDGELSPYQLKELLV